MAGITFIKEARTKGYLSLGIIEGEEKLCLTVSERVYSSVGSPMRRDTLDEDTLAVLTAADEEYRAMRKALSLLSFADNSERNLRYKLLRAGFSREAADNAVSEVVSLGYVNEDSQLERLIVYEMNVKLTGPLKLMPKLIAKGYPSGRVRAVLERLIDEGEIDLSENRRRLIEEKLDNDASDEDRRKLLYKYGYKSY